MKEYAVMFSDSNNVGLDGYEDLNPDNPRRVNRAVFDTHQQAKDHRDARAAANPSITFTVVEIDG